VIGSWKEYYPHFLAVVIILAWVFRRRDHDNDKH